MDNKKYQGEEGDALQIQTWDWPEVFIDQSTCLGLEDKVLPDQRIGVDLNLVNAVDEELKRCDDYYTTIAPARCCAIIPPHGIRCPLPALSNGLCRMHGGGGNQKTLPKELI